MLTIFFTLYIVKLLLEGKEKNQETIDDLYFITSLKKTLFLAACTTIVELANQNKFRKLWAFICSKKQTKTQFFFAQFFKTSK